MDNYLYENESYKIIGILFEVHKNLGKGFSEIVYRDAIEIEFQMHDLFYEREKEYSVSYKDQILKHKFYADFIVYNKIVLEVKSCEALSNVHVSQCLNYLKVSQNKLAILVNFNKSSLEHKRIICN